MVRLLSLLWLLALVLTASGASLSSRLDTVEISGRTYNRLADWARPSGFDLKWLTKDKTLLATGRLGRMLLEIDSRKVEINGVMVSLCFPVALKGGQAHIAPIDLQLNFRPIFYPARNDDGGLVKTICLDAGHGGKDPGNTEGSREEKEYTFLLCRELSSQLREAGFRVITTRSKDEYIEKTDRPAIANKAQADLFISLHFNSAPATSASGIEVYCLTPAGAPSSQALPEASSGGALPGNKLDEKNVLLAYQVQKGAVQATDTDDRGVKRARYVVLKTAKMPAILVEGGFMTNPAESRHIYDTAFRKKLAKGIVDGINAYKKQVER